MDQAVEARIVALEEELAELKRLTTRPSGPSAAAASAPRPGPTSANVSRRRLLWAGGAAAGAAGVALVSASPAGAQTPPAASDVTFTPAGNISATNVQAALVEVDGEKAGLATGGQFSAPVTFSDARFQLAPIIDARAYGAGTEAGADDTPKLQNAINVASFIGGGTVYLPPGRYRLMSELVVPNNVDIWGGGAHSQSGETKGTVIAAYGAGARLVFEGEGGQSGNFQVHGRDLANPANGLVYITGVERTFTTLRVTHSASDGMVIDKAQNCTFVGVMVAQHGRDGLVLDWGAGGNAFMRCEFGACVRDSIVIRETHHDGPYNKPSHNIFLHSIAERGQWQGSGFTGPNNSQLMVTDGTNNKFSHCVFSLQTNTSTSGFLVVCTGGLDLHRGGGWALEQRGRRPPGGFHHVLQRPGSPVGRGGMG
jgi:Pectate lyase superfamily protein